MATLQQIRQLDPRYSDIPDVELAFRVWDSNYKGTLPMGIFADRIGLSNEQFKGMMDFGKSQGYTPSSTGYAEGYTPPLAPALTALRGASLGAGENISAATAAAVEKLSGGERPYGEYYQDYLERQRGMMDQYAQESPTASFLTELGGGLATGGTALKAGQPLLRQLPAPIRNVLQRPLVQAGVGGAIGGGIYGAMTAEGNAKQRLAEGGQLAIPSALFGFGTQAIVNVVRPIATKIASSWSAATRKPTVDSLRRVKNEAYNAADEAGIFFQPADMQRLYRRAEAITAFRDVVEEADPQTKAALTMLQNYRNQQVSLGVLDNIRQGLSKRYKNSGYSDQAILDMIDAVDEIIQTSGPGNELMLAARSANNAYKKAELIDFAFDKAQRSADAAGTGGNMQNRYRQVINNILNSNDIRFFNDQEVSLMRSFVEGDTLDNVLRVVGKLDPSSGGLMLALNVGAYMAEPSSIAAGAAGAAGRAAAEGRTAEKAQGIFDLIATGQMPAPRQALVPPAAAPIVMGTRERERERIGR